MNSRPDQQISGEGGALAGFGLFRKAAPDSLRVLSGLCRLQSLAAGDPVFSRDGMADDLVGVVAGQIRLFVQGADGREAVIELAGPGSLLNLGPVVEPSAHWLSAAAVTDATVLRVPAASFRQALAEDFGLGRATFSRMSVVLRRLVRQATDLKLRGTAERLAAHLLGLAAPTEGAAVVQLPYEKQLLAARLGMEPESLSRAIARLRQEGVTEQDGGFTIHDTERLARFCGADDGFEDQR